MLHDSLNTSQPNRRRTESATKMILLVAGTRSDLVRLAPLNEALNHSPEAYRPMTIYTGHYRDDSISDDLFEQQGLPKPDVCLEVGSGTQGFQTGKTLVETEKLILEQKPDMVVVSGETNSAMASAISAAHLRVPMAHVGAGLRSNDFNMPDEIARVVTDRISTLFFTTCEDANINLLREGAAEDAIHFVGNILIDSLCRILPETDDLSVLGDLGIEPGNYTLVAINRPDHFADPERLRKIVSMLDGLASLAPTVLAIHPLMRENLLQLETSNDNCTVFDNRRIRITEPRSYLELLKLEKDSAVVITDTGDVQEETTFLGVRCITVTSNTARPVTITDGTNTLIGLNPDRVITFAKEYLRGDLPDRRLPLLWDGKTAGRIVDAINGFFCTEETPEPAGIHTPADVEVVGGRP